MSQRDAQRATLSAKGASQARSMLALLLARDQKYLCLLEAGASGRMLSSPIPDELKLVAHPVGRALSFHHLQPELSKKGNFMPIALLPAFLQHGQMSIEVCIFLAISLHRLNP
jgi:hypothetical protein